MVRSVAVIGPLRSGKDTAATALVIHNGYTRMSLADPLKDEVVMALNAVDGGGWTRERLEEEKRRLRPLLQVWGTELRRKTDPDYWVRRLEAQIYAHQPYANRIVVTDARFTNELDMLRKHGFIIVRLVMEGETLRNHLHRVAYMNDEEIDKALNHLSEREWKAYPADFEVASVPGDFSFVKEVGLLCKTPVEAS